MKSLKKIADKQGKALALPDWDNLFGRRAPLEVDLGCGRGYFARLRASEFPEINQIALDARIKWIELLQARIQKEKITNLQALRCDVTQDLPVLFAQDSVAGFTIHHPDPWWKKRHRKRRLIQPALVEQFASLLAPQGWVFIQTDVPDLATEIRQIFESNPDFTETDAERIRIEKLGGLSSHREKKCLQLGIPVNRLAFYRGAKKPGEP
jgi:tRNA (guanine-N7-)-methyltransferase